MTQLSILVYVAWSWKAATRLFKSCQAKDAQTGKHPPAWISARSLQGALSMMSQADSCQVVYYQHPAPACEMRKQVLTLQQPCSNCLRHTVPWKRPISPKPFSISLPWSLLRAVDKNPHTAKCRASVSPQSIEKKKKKKREEKKKERKDFLLHPDSPLLWHYTTHPFTQISRIPAQTAWKTLS